MTSKFKLAYLVMALIMCGAYYSDAEEPAKTDQPAHVPKKELKVIFDQDMEKVPLGAPKWETGLINNTWTGDACEIKVVDTSTEFGKALEIDVSNFSQISLGGPYSVEKGVKLRVSGSIMSQPPMDYTLYLRRGPGLSHLNRLVFQSKSLRGHHCTILPGVFCLESSTFSLKCPA